MQITTTEAGAWTKKTIYGCKNVESTQSDYATEKDFVRLRATYKYTYDTADDANAQLAKYETAMQHVYSSSVWTDKAAVAVLTSDAEPAKADQDTYVSYSMNWSVSGLAKTFEEKSGALSPGNLLFSSAAAFVAAVLF